MIKQIETFITELRKSCDLVEKKDNYKEIIVDLKDTLNAHPEGWGLSAPQLNYKKQISLIKIPRKIDSQTKRIEYSEFILINPVILEKIGKPSMTIGEGCLSFPGVKVNTRRFLYIAVEYLDEKLEKKTGIFQGDESLAVQHEYDHLHGITIFDRKWKSKI